MEDSRARILETARGHFLQKSYHGATLREIARDAGVTTGSLYHHFSGKDELFVEVCMEGMRHLLRRLQTATRLTEGRPMTERLLALFDAYAAFFLEERAYYELIERLQLSPDQLNIGPALAARVAQATQQIFDGMVQMLGEAEPGLVPEELPQRVLTAVAMAEGLVACERKGFLSQLGLSLGAVRGVVLSLFARAVTSR
jgi:AcrR family transcriptional regulator